MNGNWWRRFGYLLLVMWGSREAPPPTRVAAVYVVDEMIKIGIVVLVANVLEWGYHHSLTEGLELRGFALGPFGVGIIRWPGADTEVTPSMVMALA